MFYYLLGSSYFLYSDEKLCGSPLHMYIWNLPKCILPLIHFLWFYHTHWSDRHFRWSDSYSSRKSSTDHVWIWATLLLQSQLVCHQMHHYLEIVVGVSSAPVKWRWPCCTNAARYPWSHGCAPHSCWCAHPLYEYPWWVLQPCLSECTKAPQCPAPSWDKIPFGLL